VKLLIEFVWHIVGQRHRTIVALETASHVVIEVTAFSPVLGFGIPGGMRQERAR
jgi:hypothetical protein